MNNVQVFDWLLPLVEWIFRRFKRNRRQRKRTRVLKHYYSDNCALLRLERETKGAVATYRAVPKVGDWAWLITLDYLRELEAEMAGEFNGTTFFLRPHIDYSTPPLSHRLAVFRLFSTGTCQCVGCWDVNLEVLGKGYAASSITPIRIFHSAVLKILQIEPTRVLSWQQQMEMMSWMGLMEEAAKGYWGREFKLVSRQRL